ncbi:MAG TPA: Sir2 family NAD-dependent protein deacetylase [Candidatus Aquicultor sp.]
MLQTSNFAVAFTGAGISTLSGIKDFRGKDGLYKEKNADKIFDIDYFYENPAFYYGETKDMIYNLDAKEPSLVHTELARLEAKGIIKAVVTQNIDLLHQKAGSQKVIELHGSPQVHFCISCQREYDFCAVVGKLAAADVPLCDSCNGVLKPKIVFYGESLPFEAIEDAVSYMSRADLVLVLGSSLVVQPAASMPLYALESDGRLVIVNDLPTPLDPYASLRYDDLAETFTFISENM